MPDTSVGNQSCNQPEESDITIVKPYHEVTRGQLTESLDREPERMPEQSGSLIDQIFGLHSPLLVVSEEYIDNRNYKNQCK